MLLNVLRELLIRKKVQQWPLFNILLSKLDFLGNEASHENFYSIFVLYFVVETLRTQLYRKLRITLYMWKKNGYFFFDRGNFSSFPTNRSFTVSMT